jgi:hypothetical protein
VSFQNRTKWSDSTKFPVNFQVGHRTQGLAAIRKTPTATPLKPPKGAPFGMPLKSKFNNPQMIWYEPDISTTEALKKTVLAAKSSNSLLSECDQFVVCTST